MAGATVDLILLILQIGNSIAAAVFVNKQRWLRGCAHVFAAFLCAFGRVV